MSPALPRRLSNNGIGIAGVAWGARVMPVKVLDQYGEGWYSDIAAGIIYAADNGAKIINLSLGGAAASQTLCEAAAYALQKGALLVAATGNGGAAVSYPAACDGVLAVAATDRADQRAGFSNFGPQVDLAAPGVDIYSTWPWLDGYFTRSGTSMAAPHVAGVAALVWSRWPAWTNVAVSRQITETAMDVDAAGWDAYTGWGRLDAAAAVGAAPFDPTRTPTATATQRPTAKPSATVTPTATPTVTPTDAPTATPTTTPTAKSTLTVTPAVPSATPTVRPTVTRTSAAAGPVFLPLVLRPQPLPAAPALHTITPPDDSATYVVRWDAASGANSYVLEWATSPGFEDATQVYAGPDTSYQAASAGIATYYYRVEARNAWGDSGWSNVQTVEVHWEREPNGEAVDATGPMQTGVVYYGVLTSASDVKDYFYFELTMPRSVNLDLTNMVSGQDFDLVLRDASLVQLKYSGKLGSADEHISASLSAGRYYVQVYRRSGDIARPYHLQGTW